jgi:hypothetical protein
MQYKSVALPPLAWQHVCMYILLQIAPKYMYMDFHRHPFIVSEFVHSCVGKEGINHVYWVFKLANSWPNKYIRSSPATVDYLAFFFEQWYMQPC